MKHPFRGTFHALTLSLIALSAAAAPGDPNSPVGAWRTIDDKTGNVRSLVQVHEEPWGREQ